MNNLWFIKSLQCLRLITKVFIQIKLKSSADFYLFILDDKFYLLTAVTVSGTRKFIMSLEIYGVSKTKCVKCFLGFFMNWYLTVFINRQSTVLCFIIGGLLFYINLLIRRCLCTFCNVIFISLFFT